MPAWIKDGRIQLRSGSACFGVACPDPCTDCGCGYTMPSGKYWKLDIGSLNLSDGRCDCCDELEGPFILDPYGPCGGCCIKRFCSKQSATTIITDYYLYALLWIQDEGAACSLNVVFGIAYSTRLADDPYVAPDCPPISLNSISRTDYKVTMADAPGELAGPWTVTRQTDEVCEYSPGEGPPDTPDNAVPGEVIGSELNPCGCFDEMPTAFGVSLVVDVPNDCGDITATCPDVVESSCYPCGEVNPPASIFVNLTNVPCCMGIEDLHTFDLVALLSTECCLFYYKDLITHFCVSTEFAATAAFVMICYNADANETTFHFGWLNLAGNFVLTPGFSKVEGGPLDCTGFTVNMTPDAGSGCDGDESWGMTVSV